MGFSPREVDSMSLWEFSACVDGYNIANGGEEEVEPPSEEQHFAMVKAAKEMQTRH